MTNFFRIVWEAVRREDPHFPLPEAVEALRYLVEGRPFGRVVLTV
jgi:hypothetical protein